jgi:hypothetical protein
MNTQEIWKAVADSNGIYHISSYGRVKSYKFGREVILKLVVTSTGYLKINTCTKGKRKTEKIHRLVAKAFIANPENKPEVNHKDGNKLNNHIDNLEWTTHKENQQHAWDNGLCESTRVANIKRQSKPVIDIVTKNKYDSLKLACKDIGENYRTHLTRIFYQRKNQRFFYLTDGNR